MAPPERQRKRQQSSKPVVEALHAWLVAKRQGLVKADATAKAIDYALSNWKTLIRFLDDGNVPIDTDAFDKGFSCFPLSQQGLLSRAAGPSRTRRNVCSLPLLCRRGPVRRRGRASRCSHAQDQAFSHHAATAGPTSVQARATCTGAEPAGSTRSPVPSSACAR
ncbi:hypothetical protein EXH51_26595 [Pelomonas saccharophila]|nr:hypothetical protein [Roseateles saccharophilus]